MRVMIVQHTPFLFEHSMRHCASEAARGDSAVLPRCRGLASVGRALFRVWRLCRGLQHSERIAHVHGHQSHRNVLFFHTRLYRIRLASLPRKSLIHVGLPCVPELVVIIRGGRVWG